MTNIAVRTVIIIIITIIISMFIITISLMFCLLVSWAGAAPAAAPDADLVRVQDADL